MAKEDLLPFKYDAKTNTVYNTSGDKIVPVVKTKPSSRSWILVFIDWSARLLAWYVLYMIFWACPDNARLDPSLPVVCQRYDSIKHSVAPHIKPYYDTYAEPYLARAQPYLSKGQGYYEQFGAPAVAKGQDLWVKQATPRLRQGYSVVNSQYYKNVHPALDRYVLQKSRDSFDKYVHPHVQTLSDHYSKSVHPYLSSAQEAAQKVYTQRIIPAYRAIAPRVHHALRTAENTYAKHVEPRVHAVIKWILRKIDQVVIPRVKILWGVHVQPQLDRIQDKLFRNREAKQVASKIVEEGKTTHSLITSHALSQHIETASPTPTLDPLDEVFAEYDDEIKETTTANPEPSEIPYDERPALNRPVQVDALLDNWRTQIRNAGVQAEEVFIAAITEIFETEKAREEEIARNMVLELNNTVESELSSLENTVIYLAKKGKASGKDDPRYKEFNENIVASGKKIRNHAVEIRNYLKGIKERFEGKVLERRDIGWRTMDEVCAEAQLEVGNTWMWLADITYDDWQQYHGLHDMTQTIKQRIHTAGAGRHFDIMAKTQEDAEAQVNAVAKEAAKRLTQLKEIGREKIMLGDASHDFGSNWIPAGVRLVAENVKEKVSEIISGTQTPTGVVDQIMEGVSMATEVVASAAGTAATQISEAIYGTPQGIAESVVSQVSKAVVGEEPPLQSKILSSAQDALSSATEIAGDAVSKASAVAEDVASKMGSVAGDAVSKALAAVPGTPQGVVESLVSQASKAVVGEEPPLQSKLASSAQDMLRSATEFAGEAMSKASTAVLGTPQGAVESVVSQVSKAVVGEEPPLQSKIISSAKEAVNSAQDAAESVASQISTAILGTPQGVGESIASQLSTAILGAPQGAVESVVSQITSVAGRAADSAASATSVVGDMADSAARSAASVASAAGEGIVNAKDKAQKVFKAPEPGLGEKVASVASSVASEMSEKVVGTEPGTIEKATSVVGGVVGDVTSKVAEMAGSAGSAVTSVASEVTEAYGAATSKVWENSK